jgi:hypothetical protein
MKERIYGLDTGGYDPQKIATMADWELFLEYYSITLLAWRMVHDTCKDYSKGYISEKGSNLIMEEIERLQYPIEYLLYTISKRIKIEVNEPEAGRHIVPNREMFMKWYEFHDDHFMHKMSQSAWDNFEQKCKDGADVSEFLPVGDWHEYKSSSFS